LLCRRLPRGEDESSDAGAAQRFQFERTVTYALIAHQHNPPFNTGSMQPGGVVCAEANIYSRAAHLDAGSFERLRKDSRIDGFVEIEDR
jgi:hypothetical protein